MDSSDDEDENYERYVIILASSKQKAFLIAMDLTKMRPLALQIFESDNDLVPRGEPICLLVPESLESTSGTRNSFYKNESLCSLNFHWFIYPFSYRNENYNYKKRRKGLNLSSFEVFYKGYLKIEGLKFFLKYLNVLLSVFTFYTEGKTQKSKTVN